MKINGNHLQRYKQIAKLLWKYGRSDLVKQMEIEDALETEDRNSPTADVPAPEQLATDLEAMGPTFVKLGQVLSSRPDLLPEPYLKALARLQDDVKPFPFAQVQEIVEGELGARISKAFDWFEVEPIAAASLGQVHCAALRDGRPVAVKVQRPGIDKQVTEDFEVLAQIADFLDAHTDLGRRHRLGELIQEFRRTLQHELDYEREAQNLSTMAANLAEFETITVPLPVPDYTTRRVLTMDFVTGRKITKVSPLVRLEVNGSVLANDLFKAYLKQVLVDGIFHADPHPGNVFLTDENTIALLDLGMVGHTTPAMQVNLLKILIAVSGGRAEEAAKVVCAIGETTEDFDMTAFNRRIAQIVADRQDRGLKQINVGRTLLQVTRTAADSGLYVPTELTLLGKTLLQLDEVGKILDPEFDPNAAVRREAADIMARRLRKDATQGGVLQSVLEMKEFVAGLPMRLNRIMDAVTGKELEVKVRAVDANLMMEGLQKVANRITTGIVLAALIIGASLLMRVETSFRVLGYPGLAMLCFLAAAAGGFWLVITIILHDRRSARRPG